MHRGSPFAGSESARHSIGEWSDLPAPIPDVDSVLQDGSLDIPGRCVHALVAWLVFASLASALLYLILAPLLRQLWRNVAAR